jgi:hypothetical protein
MRFNKKQLDEFRRRIIEAIQRYRIDEELVGGIIEEEKFSNYIFRKSEPDKQESLPKGGTMIVLSPLITENVKPERICIKADLSAWINYSWQMVMDTCLEDLARSVTNQEATFLVNGLLKDAKEFEAQATELSKSDIKKAVDWIHQNALSFHTYPNILVMHPRLEAEFEKRGDIVEVYRLPKDLFNGSHFSGRVNGLNVFSIAHIPPNIILIYDKQKIRLRRSKIRVDFDSIKKPRYLLVREERKVWSVDPNALAKLALK